MKATEQYFSSCDAFVSRYFATELSLVFFFLSRSRELLVANVLNPKNCLALLEE